MDAIDEIDWKRKRIEPNIKQVAKKLNAHLTGATSTLSTGIWAPHPSHFDELCWFNYVQQFDLNMNLRNPKI